MLKSVLRATFGVVAVVTSLVSIAAASAETKPPALVVTAYSSPYSNQVELILVNQGSETVTSLIVEAQLIGRYDHTEPKTFLFKFVDPGEAGSATTSWDRDAAPSKIIVRSVTVCKIGKAYNEHCESYLQTGKQADRYDSVPVALRLSN